jgi:NADP-reducing hydrogenase subunit HndB
MERLTRKTLDELRERVKAELDERINSGKTTVLVGMGTCGIAAGSDETLSAFRSEIKNRKLEDKVVVKEAACMGLCSHEPTVEILSPDMEPVIYGDVKANLVPQVIQGHIINKKQLDTLLATKPVTALSDIN